MRPRAGLWPLFLLLAVAVAGVIVVLLTTRVGAATPTGPRAAHPTSARSTSAAGTAPRPSAADPAGTASRWPDTAGVPISVLIVLAALVAVGAALVVAGAVPLRRRGR